MYRCVKEQRDTLKMPERSKNREHQLIPKYHHNQQVVVATEGKASLRGDRVMVEPGQRRSEGHSKGHLLKKTGLCHVLARICQLRV